jgi:hypothetical protein
MDWRWKFTKATCEPPRPSKQRLRVLIGYFMWLLTIVFGPEIQLRFTIAT